MGTIKISSSTLKVLVSRDSAGNSKICTTCCPDTNPSGNPCLCWDDDSGNPFGSLPTPQFVKLTLTGISPGQAWTQELEDFLLQTHTLEQNANPSTPCSWGVVIGNWHFGWSVAAGDGNNIISAINPIEPLSAFSNTNLLNCQLSAANQLGDAPSTVFLGGTATISFFS